MITKKTNSFHGVKINTLNENRTKVKKTMGINQSDAMSYCMQNTFVSEKEWCWENVVLKSISIKHDV